jgi:hypothetical protein
LIETRGNGAELSFKDRTTISESEYANMRMLRDQILVEPLDVEYSAIIHVIRETKPLRGIVKKVGPGHYPLRYDHPDRDKRTKSWQGKTYQPTQVKPGDTVELGGSEIGGYAFQTCYVADKLHIICREADVCGIVEHAAN